MEPQIHRNNGPLAFYRPSGWSQQAIPQLYDSEFRGSLVSPV
jgi:hypothetical protein